MAGENENQSGAGEQGRAVDPLFENKLQNTGVTSGSGPAAQQGAEQQERSADDFLVSRLRPPVVDSSLAVPRISFTERNSGINPTEILPPHVLEEFSKPNRVESLDPERGMQYLAATWQAAKALASDLALDPEALYDTWMEDSKEQPADQTRAGDFSSFLQRRVSDAIDGGLEGVESDKRADVREEYLWRRKAAFAPLFAIPRTSGTTITEGMDRRNIARALSGDKDALVTHLNASLRSGYGGGTFESGEELLLGGFVTDDQLREEHALAAYAGAVTQPWKERSDRADMRRRTHGGDQGFVLEDQVFRAFVSVAEAQANLLEEADMWRDTLSAERKRALAVEPDNRLLVPIPDKVAAYLAGETPEASFPRGDVQSYLGGLKRYGGSPSIAEVVTRRVYDPEILQLEAAMPQHEEYGTAFFNTLLPKIEQAAESEQPRSGKPIQVKLDLHGGFTKIDVTDVVDGQERKLHFHIGHGEEPKITWEGDGFIRYDDIRGYLNDLDPDDITVDSDVDPGYIREIYGGGLKGQMEHMEESFGGTNLSLVDIKDRVTASGYRLVQSRALGDDLPASIKAMAPSINNPALPFYWRFADHLQNHGNLTSRATGIPLIVSGSQIETLVFPPNEPYTILQAFADSDPVIAAAEVRATGEDISFPEVTVAEGEYGKELMSQEGVYDALDALREQGFTAVLGKKMAEEFSSTASTLYVEHSLPALGYEVSHEPMDTLHEWQRQLVTAAREAGYTGDAGDFVEGGYAMTAGKEDEVIHFLQARNGAVGINGWDLAQYREVRQVFERFFDFADESGMSGYKRYSEIPEGIPLEDFDVYRSASPYSISAAATEHFAGKAVDWSLFLASLPENAVALPHFGEAYQQMRALGDQLSGELTDMSQGDVITRAKQIIHGEVAAVGEDITDPISVRTFTDFHRAIRNLLLTPKINLILLKDGSFGWEISTRENSSPARPRYF